MKDGAYINALPSWLDLEDRVYRPLLLSVLPVVGLIPCAIISSAGGRP